MHERLEVIIPPCEDAEEAVKKAMAPFREGGRDQYGERNLHTFWDSYHIGGQYSGIKLTENLGEDRLVDFYEAMNEMRVNVHMLRAGKKRIADEDVARVNALWQKHFPDSPHKVCPMYENAGYTLAGDVMLLGEVPDARPRQMLIADAQGRALYRLQTEIWNSSNWQVTAWDGSLMTGISDWIAHASYYHEDCWDRIIPTADRLVVTVDYHL